MNFPVQFFVYSFTKFCFQDFFFLVVVGGGGGGLHPLMVNSTLLLM